MIHEGGITQNEPLMEDLEPLPLSLTQTSTKLNYFTVL